MEGILSAPPLPPCLSLLLFDMQRAGKKGGCDNNLNGETVRGNAEGLRGAKEKCNDRWHGSHKSK